MHRVYKLDPAFRLNILPAAPAPPAAIEARIEEIWAEEKRRRGASLYDGRAYSLAERTQTLLSLRETDYRHLLAQRRDPELYAALGLRPVGVTGILICREGVVLGLRADHVAADAGLWEPAPAGGLDRPDPAAQLMEELAEELGVAPARVKPPLVRGLIEDTESHVLDILYRIETDMAEDELRAAQRAAGSDEYAELAVVAPSDLLGFLAARKDRLLPALRAMLRLGGLPPS
jgi:hypothetical protein